MTKKQSKKQVIAIKKTGNNVVFTPREKKQHELSELGYAIYLEFSKTHNFGDPLKKPPAMDLLREIIKSIDGPIFGNGFSNAKASLLSVKHFLYVSLTCYYAYRFFDEIRRNPSKSIDGKIVFAADNYNYYINEQIAYNDLEAQKECVYKLQLMLMLKFLSEDESFEHLYSLNLEKLEEKIIKNIKLLEPVNLLKFLSNDLNIIQQDINRNKNATEFGFMIPKNTEDLFFSDCIARLIDIGRMPKLAKELREYDENQKNKSLLKPIKVQLYKLKLEQQPYDLSKEQIEWLASKIFKSLNRIYGKNWPDDALDFEKYIQIGMIALGVTREAYIMAGLGSGIYDTELFVVPISKASLAEIHYILAASDISIDENDLAKIYRTQPTASLQQVSQIQENYERGDQALKIDRSKFLKLVKQNPGALFENYEDMDTKAAQQMTLFNQPMAVEKILEINDKEITEEAVSREQLIVDMLLDTRLVHADPSKLNETAEANVSLQKVSKKTWLDCCHHMKSLYFAEATNTAEKAKLTAYLYQIVRYQLVTQYGFGSLVDFTEAQDAVRSYLPSFAWALSISQDNLLMRTALVMLSNIKKLETPLSENISVKGTSLPLPIALTKEIIAGTRIGPEEKLYKFLDADNPQLFRRLSSRIFKETPRPTVYSIEHPHGMAEYNGTFLSDIIGMYVEDASSMLEKAKAAKCFKFYRFAP